MLALLLACSPPDAVEVSPSVATGDTGVAVAEVGSPGCPAPPDLYDPACVVRLDVAIAEEDWATMQATYDAAVADCGAVGEDRLHAWHAATLRYGAETREVGIRLKGNDCTFLRGGKMQFRVDVDHYVDGQRLRGFERLNLEAANYDPTLVKNGLALSVFRDVGLVASRANHAALYVNGAYYGVYENIEQIDGEFLEDRFEDPSGNLYWFIWNGAYGELKTNQDAGDVSHWSEMQALVDAAGTTVSTEEFAARIVELVDVDTLLLAFATEAVIPQTDGVWAGSANCYVYDDPARCDADGCFVYLPWDLDSAFLVPPLDLCPACGSEPETVDADPITFITGRGPARKWRLYELLMEIPAYEAQYVDDVRGVLDAAYDPAVLEARHAAVLERIRPYVAVDTHVDLERFEAENAELAAFFAERAAFLEGWLAERGR